MLLIIDQQSFEWIKGMKSKDCKVLIKLISNNFLIFTFLLLLQKGHHYGYLNATGITV